MSLLSLSLDKISEADIRQLITLGVVESSYLDYKRDTYGASDADRREFLADISSFANSLGGDLAIGVAEKKGIPTELTPFVGDADGESRRLEQIALSGLEPRIANLRVRAVPIAAGGHVLIVRAPRSFIPPHRVVAQGNNRFWVRAGASKHEPNVEQLRHLFTDAPYLVERIRSFQMDRLVKIMAGETPFRLNQAGKVVVHVVPLPSFADNRFLDIISVLTAGNSVPLPLDDIGMDYQQASNLDGYINCAVRPATSVSAYAQFFRNGTIEGVSELRHDKEDGNSHFVGSQFTNMVVSRVKQYLQVLKSYEAGLPVYIFLSLCSADRVVYRYAPTGMGWYNTAPLGRTLAIFPEIYIDSFDADVPTLMRPLFNVLWNAFGMGQCDMYDNQGKWRGSS